MASNRSTFAASRAERVSGSMVASGYDYDSLVSNIYSIASGPFATNSHSELLSGPVYSFAKFCEDNGGTPYVTLYRDTDENPSIVMSCDLPDDGTFDLVYDNGSKEYRLLFSNGDSDVVISAGESNMDCMVDDQHRLVCRTSKNRSGRVPGFVIDGRGRVQLTDVDATKIKEWNFDRF